MPSFGGILVVDSDMLKDLTNARSTLQQVLMREFGSVIEKIKIYNVKWSQDDPID